MTETAIHEGTHARVATQFAFKVSRVFLCPPGREAAGVCEVDDWLAECDRDGLRALVYLLAPSVAVTQMTGRPAAGCEGDRAQAAILASLIVEQPKEHPRTRELLRDAETLARALVANPDTVAAIARIATALDAKGVLTGAEVERLCTARR